MAGQRRDNALEERGKTRKVYVAEPDRFSAGLTHSPRLKDRFEPHHRPFAQVEVEAAAGDSPDLSVIEPCLILGHYRSAVRRAVGHGLVLTEVDPSSSILISRGSTCCIGEGTT